MLGKLVAVGVVAGVAYGAYKAYPHLKQGVLEGLEKSIVDLEKLIDTEAVEKLKEEARKKKYVDVTESEKADS